MKNDLPALAPTLLLVVGLIASVLALNNTITLQSNAASANAIEPENGTLAGNVAIVTDTSASGGKYVSLGTVTTPTPALQPTPPAPGTWRLVFSDDFNGTSYDKAKWADASSAEADAGHGNLGNQQLEWNQGANCLVANGELQLTARREAYTSASGKQYSWTSCLLTSSPSYAFTYGYIEERAILPAPKGFWPAFWTWQAPGGNTWQETDVYEFYSDNHTRLYLTSHVGAGGGCTYIPPFDPSAGWHVYGADISPNGTDWYIDGIKVCHAAGAPSALTNIITNLAVYSQIPPDATTQSASKRVDYIRAWAH